MLDTRSDVAHRRVASQHAKQVALMRFLSVAAQHLGVAKHTFVVGGAVRNFVLEQPIKDVDLVLDEIASGRTTEWFANQLARLIPAQTNLVTNVYGVAILTVKDEWLLGEHDLQGEQLEIAPARTESYGGDAGKGYKPEVVPATIQEDVVRREFTFNCMAGDTLIPTERGLLRIDEIALRSGGDQQRIDVVLAGRDGAARAIGWQYSGMTETLRVTTDWGHSFACTHHHPVLILRGHDHVWVQADQLSIGDLVCLPAKPLLRQDPLQLELPDSPRPKHGRLKPVRKPSVMTPELAFIMGCVVAEGSNTNKRVSFSNGDEALIDRYVECFDRVFGVRPSRHLVAQAGDQRVIMGVLSKANRDAYDVYADSRAIVGWLRHLGLYCDGPQDGKSASYYKVVPWAILQADGHSQAAFLAGYLEGDGSIRPDTGIITFTSVSATLRAQIQCLLGAHGALARIEGACVRLTARDAAILWSGVAPFMVSKGFDYEGRAYPPRNRYGVPVAYLHGFLDGRQARSNNHEGTIFRTDASGEVPFRNWGSRVNRRAVRLLHDAHDQGAYDGLLDAIRLISPSEHDRLAACLAAKYQYVPIVSVEDAGTQDVYDLSMGEGVEPAFVANGVIVHNTLMWRLLDLAHGPDRAEIIDLTGCGLSDLQNRVMRCPASPDKTFSDDPTRMLRAVSFFVRYGLKITPDTEAAIRRNAPALKRMPHNAVSKILIDKILPEHSARKALVEMARLGLLDVVREMIQEVKPFREALTNWANDQTVQFMFDLMDLGLPLATRAGFLTPPQQARLREAIAAMDVSDAAFLLAALKQPGKVLDTVAVAAEFNLVGRDMARIGEIARDAILDDPSLATSPDRLTQRVRNGLQATRMAKRYQMRPMTRRMPQRPSAARVARAHMAATRREAGPSEWLKWIVQPFEVLWKHHMEFVQGPVDDAVDAIIKDLAPILVKKLTEREVESDVDDFLRGALAGRGEVSYGHETPDFMAGYTWGHTHPDDLDGGRLPDWMRKQVIQESIQDFRHRITEQVITDTLKKVWHAISPVETFKLIKSAVKKHGWKMGVFIALVECFEHFILPGLLAWTFNNPKFLALVELPFGEIVYAVVFRMLGKVPGDVDQADPDGHLDWYEDQYGPVRIAGVTC